MKWWQDMDKWDWLVIAVIVLTVLYLLGALVTWGVR
jgi:hypothetical protein